jgi:hypothetical protein
MIMEKYLVNAADITYLRELWETIKSVTTVGQNLGR